MLELRWKGEFEESTAPFVAVLRDTAIDLGDELTDKEIAGTREESGIIRCKSTHGSFTITRTQNDEFDGDVVLCEPKASRIHRLFRRASTHNSLMLTERCDQMCVMCSQPPKKSKDAWRFKYYREALLLVPEDARITISGGEPTLYKKELFELLRYVNELRPDISFHVLSNAQHLVADDIDELKNLHSGSKLTWGIPLYSADIETHELIVGKEASFNNLINNLYILASAGAEIELRTVLTGLNALDIPRIAVFISDHLPFISTWAIMALEPIGYALANKDKVFYDHGLAPQPIYRAIELSNIHSINIRLYNFPLCTISENYREYCDKSISDWKNKYVEVCEDCAEKKNCAGFFEWFNDDWAWSNIKPIAS
jgi:His-Xaa-Ser system radical SAM maturase HxsC